GPLHRPSAVSLSCTPLQSHPIGRERSLPNNAHIHVRLLCFLTFSHLAELIRLHAEPGLKSRGARVSRPTRMSPRPERVALSISTRAPAGGRFLAITHECPALRKLRAAFPAASKVAAASLAVMANVVSTS